MGGLLIVAAITISTLLWADLRNPYVLLAVAATLCFRDDRVRRRLQQGGASKEPRADGEAEVFLSGADVRVRGRGPAGLAGKGRVLDAAERAVPEAAASRSGDRFATDAPVHLAAGVRAVRFVSGDRDRGLLERREPDGRPGRTGDWVRADFVGGADGDHLCFEQRALRRISRDSEDSGRRRADDFLRLAGGRFAGIPLVQRASRRKCSWATWARSRWAERSGRSP